MPGIPTPIAFIRPESNAQRRSDPTSRLLLVGRKPLVDGANLLLYVEILQVAHLRLAFALGVAVQAVHDGLFAASQLVFRNRLASNGVEDVASLARQPLQIIGNVGVRNIGLRVARVGSGLLLLPAGVEELDCASSVLIFCAEGKGGGGSVRLTPHVLVQLVHGNLLLAVGA